MSRCFTLIQGAGDFVYDLPSLYARMMEGVEWCEFLPFNRHRHRLAGSGLVLINRDPLGPLAAAAMRAAQEVERNMGSH